MRGRIVGTPAGYYIDLCWQGRRYKIRNRGKAFKSERHAFRALEAINEEIDHNELDITYWAPSQRKKHLVKHLVKKWCESQDLRPCTLYQRRLIIKNVILPNWGTRDIRKLRKHHFMGVFREMPSNYHTRRIVAQTQAFLRWAYREEILDRPTFLDRPKVQKREKVWLTAEQQELVIQTAQSHYRPIFRFIVCYGCRFGEATALQWDAVDFDKNWISFKRSYSNNVLVDGTKEGPCKGVPMTKQIRQMLIEMKLKRRPDPHVFLNKWHKHYTTDLSRAWKEAAERAGFKGSTLHGNRHSFVTQKVAEGFSLKQIGSVTGQHEQTAEGYAHQDPKSLLKVIEGV